MTTHTTRDRLLVCLVVATVAIAPLTVGAAAAAGTTTVEQTDPAGELTLEVTEETDETVTVTLSTDVEDVAGYQAHLEFDPDATAVQSVAGGSGEYEADPVTNVDNENGTVQFNQIAGSAPEEGEDAPTMATLTFETPDEETGVSFVDDDSLVATSEPEDVTDLLRTGVTLATDETDDDGDGPGGGDDPGDGGGGPGDGGDAPGSEDDDADAGDGAGGGQPGATGAAADTSADEPVESVDADVTPTAGGASLSATDVDAGTTVNANFGDTVGDESVTVDGLSIETAVDVGLMTVDVRTHGPSDLPDGTPELDAGASVSYVEFDTDGFESDAVASATVEFTADIDELETDAAGVTLYRFTDGDWTALETTAEEDGAFTATTPGFSTFAVGSSPSDDVGGADQASASGEDGDAGSEETPESAAGDETSDDVNETFGGGATLTLGLVILVVLTATGVALRRR